MTDCRLLQWAVYLTTVDWADNAAAKCLDIFRVVLLSCSRNALRVYLAVEAVDRCVSWVCKFAQPSIRADVVRLLLGTGVYAAAGVGAHPVPPRLREDVTNAVFLTATGGTADVLRLLLTEARVDAASVRHHEDAGVSLLHVVKTPDAAEKVQLLVAAGADLEAQDSEGWTPLQAAMLTDLPSYPAFDALLAAGADPRPLGRPFRLMDGGPPHAYAIVTLATRGDVEGMRRLLDPSIIPAVIIDVNVRQRNNHCTALFEASILNHHRIAQMLVGAGVDVHAEGPGGSFALAQAASYGSYKVAKVLVKAGALIQKGRSVRGTLLRSLRLWKDNEALLATTSSRLTSNSSPFFPDPRRSPAEVREGMIKTIALLETRDVSQ